MATVSEVRTALQASLATISGLRAYDVWPDQPSVPCALVRLSGGEYSQEFGGDYLLRLDVVLLVTSAAGADRGSRLLDGYLSPTGATSIAAALDDGQTRVVGFSDYGLLEVNGLPYYGVRLSVEVMA